MATFSNSNTRVFYATQAVALGAIGNTSAPVDGWVTADGATSATTGAATIVHGVQSVGIDTNFNLEQAFELGQLSLYENIEDIPEISVSMQKFLDGYSLMYHLGASYDSAGALLPSTNNVFKTTLSGRADTRADFRMVVNATTEEAVTVNDSGVAEVYNSGMYISSVGLTIPTDGTCTEDIGLVGNNKKWITDNTDGQLVLLSSTGVVGGFGSIFGNDAPNAPDGHVLRRDDVVTSNDTIQTYKTVLPDIVEGVTAMSDSSFKGRNAQNAGIVDTTVVHVQSFSTNVDLGREQINQLGTRTPYNRYVNFPTEVTSSIEVIATAGDNVNAVETNRSNLSNHEICICLSDSTVIHLGKKNKISSITYGGGDAGGGNASITYSFSNFNDFVILHSGDPIRDSNTSATQYWADKFSS
jgi:hypothetical protein